jgi:hypothetical protein
MAIPIHHAPDPEHDAAVLAAATVYVATVKALPHFQKITAGDSDADKALSALNTCVAGLVLHSLDVENMDGPPTVYGIGNAVGSWLCQTGGIEPGTALLLEAIQEGASGAAKSMSAGSC